MKKFTPILSVIPLLLMLAGCEKGASPDPYPGDETPVEQLSHGMIELG